MSSATTGESKKAGVPIAEFVVDNVDTLRCASLSRELGERLPAPLCDIVRNYDRHPLVFRATSYNQTTQVEVPYFYQESSQSDGGNSAIISKTPTQAIPPQCVEPTPPQCVDAKRVGLTAVYRNINTQNVIHIEGNIYIQGDNCIYVKPLRPASTPGLVDTNGKSVGHTIDYPPLEAGYSVFSLSMLKVPAPPASWARVRACENPANGNISAEVTPPTDDNSIANASTDETCAEELWLARSLCYSGTMKAGNSADCTELWRYHGRGWCPVFDLATPLETVFESLDSRRPRRSVVSPWHIATCTINVGTSGSWLKLQTRDYNAVSAQDFSYNLYNGKVFRWPGRVPLFMASVPCPWSRRGVLHSLKDLVSLSRKLEKEDKDTFICKDENCVHDGLLILDCVFKSNFTVTLSDCNAQTVWRSGGDEFWPNNNDDEEFQSLGFDRRSGTLLVAFRGVTLSYSLVAILQRLFELKNDLITRGYVRLPDVTIPLKPYTENVFVHASPSRLLHTLL